MHVPRPLEKSRVNNLGYCYPMISAAVAPTAFSALIWWAVPAIALIGAFSYVIWVSKFQDKFENETNRSVTKFQSFQERFRESQPVILIPQDLDQDQDQDQDQSDPSAPQSAGEPQERSE